MITREIVISPDISAIITRESEFTLIYIHSSYNNSQVCLTQEELDKLLSREIVEAIQELKGKQ